MTTMWFLTHLQVVVDAQVPVSQWGLSDVGRSRAEASPALPSSTP